MRVLAGGQPSHVNGGRDVRPDQEPNVGLELGPWVGPSGKWYWENSTSTCKRVKLDVHLTSYSRISKHRLIKNET